MREPVAETGEWEGEEALGFGAVHGGIGWTWRPGIIFARARIDPGGERGMFAGEEFTDLETGEAFGAAEMVDTAGVLVDEFPGGACDDVGAGGAAVFVNEEV